MSAKVKTVEIESVTSALTTKHTTAATNTAGKTG
jgi:hypothetical protein